MKNLYSVIKCRNVYYIQQIIFCKTLNNHWSLRSSYSSCVSSEVIFERPNSSDKLIILRTMHEYNLSNEINWYNIYKTKGHDTNISSLFKWLMTKIKTKYVINKNTGRAIQMKRFKSDFLIIHFWISFHDC